ncbi:MAG: hypothetical protein AB7E96_06600 [Deferribacterales bacterium]
MVLRSILAVLLTISLMSCASVEKLKTQVMPSTQKNQPETPVQPSVTPPPPPPVVKQTAIVADPLENVYISIDSVQQSLSSILYMIAAEAGLNLIISPDVNVSKPFTLTVKHMPARDALKAITENAGVYYVIDGNSLKIKSVITKMFKMPYVRTTPSQSSLIGGDIFGANGDENTFIHGDYTLEYKSDKDRGDIQNQIIGHVRSIMFPESADSETQTAPVPVVQQPAQGGTQEALQSVMSQVPALQSSSTSKQSSSAAKSGATEASTTGGSYFKGSQGYNYNIFTGILRVTTTPDKMKEIEEFLAEILKELNKQVLIEARLVEVVLNDSSAYGINWTGDLFQSDYSGTFNLGYANSALLGGLSPIGTITGGNVSKFLTFMAAQGRVESVGNPRLRVMNGQSAMISSGQLLPYWEVTKDDETSDGVTTTTYTYDRVMVLDGLILGVTPHIKDDGTVTLNIVPIFSDVEDEKTIINANGETVASYPIVNMKEAGTVLNMKSGSTVVMGGLISNVETTMEEKIPFLGDIPVLGNLFKGKAKKTEKRELVIFLTTTIIDGSL